MIETALIVFFVAALMGVFLLRYIFRDMPAPKGVALVHGLAGGPALFWF